MVGSIRLGEQVSERGNAAGRERFRRAVEERDRSRGRDRRRDRDREEPEERNFASRLAGNITGRTFREAAERQGGRAVNLLAPFMLGGGAAGAAAIDITATGKTGVITRTAEELIRKGTSLTTQRSFIGKGGKTIVDKLFKRTPNTADVAIRFPTTARSTAQTKSFLGSIGAGGVITGGLLATIGTYPFAGFIKEEALQTLSLAFKTANENNDLEGMETALAEQAELLDPALWDKIFAAVPYANVLAELKKFYNAAATKLEIDATRFASAREEIETPAEPTFEEQRQETREKTLQEREEDTAFFEEQAAASRERELQQREEDARFFEQIETRKREAELQQRGEDAAFFDQLRAEREERQAQDTLFFEAIRKRNAGVSLTEEEIAALEARGVSRDTFASGGRSTVQF